MCYLCGGGVPRIVADEAEARAIEPGTSDWPVLITAPDTAGEKPYEEFVGTGERAEATRFAALRAIRATWPDGGVLDDVLAQIEEWCTSPPSRLGKGDIVACLARAVPELRHIE